MVFYDEDAMFKTKQSIQVRSTLITLLNCSDLITFDEDRVCSNPADFPGCTFCSLCVVINSHCTICPLLDDYLQMEDYVKHTSQIMMRSRFQIERDPKVMVGSVPLYKKRS